MKASRRGLTLLALAAAGAVLTAGAIAGDNHQQATTASRRHKPSMLTPVAPGSTVTPLITVGDTLAGGYRYESIPDGISFQAKGGKHKGKDRGQRQEARREERPAHRRPLRQPRDVVRPVPVHAGRTDGGELAERLRQLAAEPPRAQRRDGRDPLGRAGDHERPELPALLLELPRRRRRTASTGRSSSRTRRASTGSSAQGKAFPATIGADDARQIGVVVAYDPKKGKSRPIWGMGRLQPREQRRRAGLRPSGRALRATTRS